MFCYLNAENFTSIYSEVGECSAYGECQTLYSGCIECRRLQSDLMCAETAERIEVQFGVKTLGGPRNIVLNGGPDPPAATESALGAAFAKLLWPLVIILCCYQMPMYDQWWNICNVIK